LLTTIMTYGIMQLWIGKVYGLYDTLKAL
jgi:hypothetical protein